MMNDINTDILKIVDVTTGYKSGKEVKIVSNNLNLSIEKGAFIALIGPNGCGKSTLLRTIAGLQKSFNGSIRISDTEIEKLKSKEKAQLLSLVLTDRVNSAYLIVEDIVGIGRYPHTGKMGVLSKKDKEIVHTAIRKCDLVHYAQTAYAELSDGEKQRVMLARALAQDTPLMMLDEPTAHLDLPNRVHLMQTLRHLAKETQKAILLSTHELDLALQWCDGIWLMNDKGKLTNGCPEDLVLNGNFSDVFSNHAFFFDVESGTFKMNRNLNVHIYISGDKVIREWTRRAIEREGFALTTKQEEADLSIKITDKKWLINHNDSSETTDSIAKLLISLKRILCTK